MDVEQIAEAVFRGVESRIEKALAPVLERIAELEGVEAPSAPSAADVARTILAGDEIKSLVDLHVAEAVSQIEPIKGDPGEPGKDGRDGLDVKDLFRAEGGRLVAVMSDGTTKDLGEFVGRDGKDGEDGVGVGEMVRAYDAETHEIVERWGEKELRYPAGGIHPGGYWREGTQSKAAQVWTHAGVAWIAKRDTSDKPSRDSDDWQIFANKGRDGRDLTDKRDAGEPVRLGASNG